MVNRVPTLSDQGVYRISVQEVCKTGYWIKQIGDDRLQLFQLDSEHIALKVNDQIVPGVTFQIAELTIPNNLWRNGYVPADCVAYFVVDESGGRFRSLYLHDRRFGTRRQLGLRYPVNVMSRRQRKVYSAGYQVRLALKRDRQARLRHERRLLRSC